MSIITKCDKCKRLKNEDEEKFTEFSLQVRVPQWINMQYHICPTCIKL